MLHRLAPTFALAALALALAGCDGKPCMGSPAGCYDRSPATLALVAGATLIAGEGGGEEGEAEFRARMAKSTRLEALCAEVAARFRDRARLRADAPQVLALGRAEGIQTLLAPRQACVGLHAEALGEDRLAYEALFFASMSSLWDRWGRAERGNQGAPALPDDLHYATLETLLRMRRAGRGARLYYVGVERLDALSCPALRREAPHLVRCG